MYAIHLRLRLLFPLLDSYAACAWCIFIRLQVQQHLPHPLLRAAVTPTDLALTTKVYQLSDPLPACSARGGVLSLSQELFCLLRDLSLLFVRFPVVVLIERVDVFLCCLDSLIFLALRCLVTTG